jgi:hypothetical protein
MEQKLVFRVSAEFAELLQGFAKLKDEFNGSKDGIEKVEKKFSDSFRKMEANVKLFGSTAENTKLAMNNLKNTMISLVAQGLDPADARIVKMKADYDSLASSINNTEGLRKANQGWMNLALVIQDLPFGFRGIQNNLPALFGSIAGAAGIAYVAFSALVAIYTAYGQQINDFIFNTTQAEKQQKLYNGVLEESRTSYIDAKKEVILLTEKVALAKQGYLDKQTVINEYNETIGKTIGKQKTLEGVNQALIDQGDAYVDYIYKLNFATLAAAKVAEASIKMIEISQKDAGEFIGGWEAFFNAKFNVGGLVASLQASTEAARAAAEKNKQTALGEAGKEAVGYENIMKSAFAAVGEAAKKITLVPGTDKEGQKAAQKTLKEAQKVAEQIAKDNVDAKKRELELYKDDAWKKYDVGVQVAEAEKQLELLKLANSEATSQQKAQLQLGIYQKYSDELLKLDQNLQTQLLETDKKKREAKKKLDKKEFDEEKKVGQNGVKQIETQLGVQEKLNKDNLIQRQEDIKAAMAKTAVLAASTFGTGAFQEYIDLYDKLQAKLDGLNIAALRGADAMKKVNSVIQDMAVNSVVLLAENIGKALGGQSVDLFGGFIELMGSGLEEIGKALIAYGLAMDAFKKAFTNPYAAIAAGVGLVIAGALLKSSISKTSGESSSSSNGPKRFANGGIVSGPTLGLMGEYPGASSNPEVVAPLDKLKDMIGGGGNGGTFVLRGQDLLLSINRAQKASALKGQNISLA